MTQKQIHCLNTAHTTYTIHIINITSQSPLILKCELQDPSQSSNEEDVYKEEEMQISKAEKMTLAQLILRVKCHVHNFAAILVMGNP